MSDDPKKQVRIKFKVESWLKEFSEYQNTNGNFDHALEFLQHAFDKTLIEFIPEAISKLYIDDVDRQNLIEKSWWVLEFPEKPIRKYAGNLVDVPLLVEQWQLDYSKRMMKHDYLSENDFLQAIINTALLRHVPEEAWPEMTDEQKAKIEEHLKRDDVDSEIPF